VRRRPSQLELSLTLERPAYVQQDEPDHIPVLVIFNVMALTGLDGLGRLSRLPDAQI
jgi:hypothetical protein